MSEQKNGWDFVINLTDHFFSLLNTGRIIPLILLMVCGTYAWIVYNSPVESIIGYQATTVNFVSENSLMVLLLVALIGSNLIWLSLFRARERQYDKEMDRLVEERKYLLHYSSDEPLIRNHNSSEDAHNEQIIVPRPNNARGSNR